VNSKHSASCGCFGVADLDTAVLLDGTLENICYQH
jgi:hypothetical protein